MHDGVEVIWCPIVGNFCSINTVGKADGFCKTSGITPEVQSSSKNHCATIYAFLKLTNRPSAGRLAQLKHFDFAKPPIFFKFYFYPFLNSAHWGP